MRQEPNRIEEDMSRCIRPSPDETPEERVRRISENVNERIRAMGRIEKETAEGTPQSRIRFERAEIMPEFEKMFEKIRADLPSKNPYPENSGAWKLFEDAANAPFGNTGLSPAQARAIVENGAFMHTMLRNQCTHDAGDAGFALMVRSTDALTASCIASVAIIDAHVFDSGPVRKWLDENLEYHGISMEEQDERTKDLWLAYAVCTETGNRRPDDRFPELKKPCTCAEEDTQPEKEDGFASGKQAETASVNQDEAETGKKTSSESESESETEAEAEAEAETETEEEDELNQVGCVSFVLKRNIRETLKRLSAFREMGEEGKAGRIGIIRKAFPNMVYGAECVRAHFSRMSLQDISEMLQSSAHPACEAMMNAGNMPRTAVGNFAIALCDYLETIGADNIDDIIRKTARLYTGTIQSVDGDPHEETLKWVDELDETIHRAMKKVRYVIERESTRVFYQQLMMCFTGRGTDSVIDNAGRAFILDFMRREDLRKDRMACYIESHSKRERERVKKALMESVKNGVSIIRSRMENPGKRYRTTDVEAWREVFLYYASFLIFGNEDLPEQMYLESEEASKKAVKEAMEAREKTEEAERRLSEAKSLEAENERLRKKLGEKTEKNGREEKERDRKVSELNRSLLEAQERIAQLEAERSRNRKEIDALTDAFSQFESETGGAEETPGDESEETRKTAERLIREFRGVFIGGHQSFISRILKLYPTWKSYSYGDKAKMDPMVFRNADAVVIFAEHMSHSLLFECKKYMKTSDAVPVYSFTTNLDALTDKISQALEDETQKA